MTRHRLGGRRSPRGGSSPAAAGTSRVGARLGSRGGRTEGGWACQSGRGDDPACAGGAGRMAPGRRVHDQGRLGSEVPREQVGAMWGSDPGRRGCDQGQQSGVRGSNATSGGSRVPPLGDPDERVGDTGAQWGGCRTSRAVRRVWDPGAQWADAGRGARWGGWGMSAPSGAGVACRRLVGADAEGACPGGAGAGCRFPAREQHVSRGSSRPSHRRRASGRRASPCTLAPGRPRGALWSRCEASGAATRTFGGPEEEPGPGSTGDLPGSPAPLPSPSAPTPAPPPRTRADIRGSTWNRTPPRLSRRGVRRSRAVP